MPRDRLRFDLVDRRDKFEHLKEFAATFNHHVNSGTRLPIVRVFRGDQLIAYYQVVNAPMAAPAFHDDLCTPRDTKEIIEHVRSHFILSSLGNDRTPNGECLVILPEQLKGGFTKEIVEKCGFVDLHQKIWHSLG